MILVTGGLGYIGSHTVVELISNGFEVVIVDDLSNSEKFILDRIEEISGVRPIFYPFDLKREELLEQVFQAHKITGIIHFAAYKAVGESQQKPLEYYENNLFSLMNVMKMCRKFNSDHFIFSSSCTVYGQADQMPITEHTPIKKAESSYGRTKQMGEDILIDYAHAYHKKVCLLRYFNPIGAHSSARIGELPLGVPNNLVPFVTQTAAGIREKLSIFGKDYPTPDGTAIRDYIHVVDLAKAHVKALQFLQQTSAESMVEIFNLGTGKGSSVLEVVQGFENATGIKLNYEFAPRRAGDITEAYADATRAKEVLGWSAETSLEDALKSAWEWQKTL